MFFQDFVEVFGLDDWENSMRALEVFTVESSSEFAIRQFILKYEEQTMLPTSNEPAPAQPDLEQSSMEDVSTAPVEETSKEKRHISSYSVAT